MEELLKQILAELKKINARQSSATTDISDYVGTATATDEARAIGTKGVWKVNVKLDRPIQGLRYADLLLNKEGLTLVGVMSGDVLQIKGHPKIEEYNGKPKVSIWLSELSMRGAHSATATATDSNPSRNDLEDDDVPF